MATEGEDIDISVSFDTDDAQAGTLALAQAIQGLSAKVGELTPKVERAKTAEELMADAAARSAAQQQAAAVSAINLGQRLQSVAGVVQNLTTQFGGQSRTAGLIGSAISSSVQFAQLGLMLGPQGALVGGIVGAAIPALALLREEMSVSVSVVDDSVRSLEELTAAYVNAGRAADLSARIAAGTETLAEATDAATQAQARYDDEATRHQTLLRVQLDTAERELASRSAVLNSLDMAYNMGTTQARQAVEDARAELEASESLTAQLLQEATARTSISAAMQAQEDQYATLATATRTGNDHNSDRARIRRREAAASGAPTREEAIGDAIAGARQRQDAARSIADAQAAEATEKQNQLLEEQIALREENASKIAESAAAEETYYAAAAERDQAHLEALGRQQDAQLAAQAEHQQAVVAQAQSTASSLMSSMTDVIGQIAEGNATAEEGAKLMLAAFLQAISQRAQIEALAQVALAIGSAASYDFAGMAGHVAAAVAWGAVAVATGVGGAAISNDVSEAQAARKEAERPASPRSNGSSDGKGGGGTTVINWNSPVVTAQTTAALGQQLTQMIGVSARRFPGSV